MKILILRDVIAPYVVSTFNMLGQNKDISLTVLVLCSNMEGRNWDFPKSKIEFDYHILNAIQIPLFNRPSFILNFNLTENLKRYNPDLIICGGYYQLAYVQALLYCRKYKKKIIAWIESHEESIKNKTYFANMYRKWFFKRCNGFIVPGKKSQSFLINRGIKEKDIYLVPNSVDNNFFIEKSDEMRKQKEEIKRKKHYPDKIVLYIGRLIREKGVYELLEAYKNIANENMGLIFVGSGKDENSLKEKVLQESIANVFFEGFKQLDDLPFYYGISDLFVFPTHSDAWGFVVNEACASGLPIISSGSPGVACELVSEQNGAIFKEGDVEDLSDNIECILADNEMRKIMGQKSREVISKYTPEISAKKIIEAVKTILKD